MRHGHGGAAAICFVAAVTRAKAEAVPLCSASNIFAGSYVDNTRCVLRRPREEPVLFHEFHYMGNEQEGSLSLTKGNTINSQVFHPVVNLFKQSINLN